MRSSLRWVGFVAARYVSKSRRSASSAAPVLAALGIGTGVLALIVIISVMNGFQLGFIESILEISSYHVRLDPFPEGPSADSLLERIRALPGVTAAVPFREAQGIIRGSRGGQQVAVIRGLSAEALEKDRAMAEHLEFEAGGFDIAAPRSILLGAELARRLSVRWGDEVTLISIAGLFPEDAAATDEVFQVTGIFRTGFYEYDLGWGFINIGSPLFTEGGGEVSLGIKLENRFHDVRAAGALTKLLAENPLPSHVQPVASSWRDYNRSFFKALRTEKLLMFVLVGLIFIVVGLNIFQSQRRSVLERREEIGLMRAVGASDTAVRLVFVWDGFLTGITGAGAGLVLALLVTFNIGAFFALLEGIVNAGVGALNFLLGLFFAGAGRMDGNFAIFSPAIFYIKEIPARIIPGEVFLIFFFGFSSALLAAWFASGRVSRIRPAEVLRYE